MKKVLCVFGSLERHGAQLRTLEICDVLHRQYQVHFDFCVLGLGSIQLREEIARLDGKIYPISIRSPRFIREFITLLRTERYDIVNSFPLLLSGIILWLARRRVPTRIASFRNSLGRTPGVTTSPAFVWLMRSLIKSSATHVVAVSQAAMASVFPPPWRTSTNCQVIYNGLALSAFQRGTERQEVRAEFGWPDDCQVLINVARFSRQKNHRTILRATRLAYERRKNIRLLLVNGATPSDEFTKLVDDHGLGDICVVAGKRMDVPRLLQASDVFFFPSLWEGLPGALLEALAAGLPAVTSDILPIREVAEHFPACMIRMAPATDAETHAEHILSALDAPVDRTIAQEHFAQRTPFVLEHSVEAYRRLYGFANTADRLP
jgi:glycosyltransferase involved in cell wall biosynthesis